MNNKTGNKKLVIPNIPNRKSTIALPILPILSSINIPIATKTAIKQITTPVSSCSKDLPVSFFFCFLPIILSPYLKSLGRIISSPTRDVEGAVPYN